MSDDAKIYDLATERRARGMLHFDRDGRPIDLIKWLQLSVEGERYKRIGATSVGDAWVSTVWLGLDHNHFGVGPPLIFETMIFQPWGRRHKPTIGGPFDQEMWRWSTLAEAEQGHAAIVYSLQLAALPFPALPSPPAPPSAA